jgi:signal transduction histidine kinase
MPTRRPGRVLARVRLLVVVIVAIVVTTADFPPGFAVWGWLTLVLFAISAIVLAITARMTLAPRTRQVVRIAALVADGAVAIAFMFVFTYELSQPLRTLYMIPIVLSALVFGVRGGFLAAVAVAPFVAAQEVFRASYFDIDTSPAGVGVRILIGGLAGLIVGQLHDELERQRGEAEARVREAEELRDRLRQRVDTLEAANRCARALASSLELDEAFGAFLRELAGIVPYDRAAVLLDEGALVSVLVSTGLGESDVYPSGSTLPSAGTIFDELRRNRRTIHREDFSVAPDPQEQLLVELGLRARVVAPLDSGEELLGALTVARCEPRSFRAYEVALLTLLGRLVTYAVQNIRTYEVERRTVEELRRLSALRADFVSLVSHELRSPMAAVIGSAQTLKAHWRELSPEHRESFLALIEDETSRLAALVGDVLDTSRLDAGTFSYSFTDVDLAKLLEETVATASVGQDEVQLRTNVIGRLPVVRGDRDRLHQVLMNLIDNAVKHSNAGDAVEIRAMPVNGAVRIDVTDRGPGIHRDAHGLIFEKFGRVQGSTSKPGTGLGLFIARSIVEAHGGALDVRSAPGEGATFTVEVPTPTPEREAD